MPEIINIDKLRQTFEKAENILVVLGNDYSLDELGAALAFLLVTKNAGKRVSVFSKKSPIVEEASLFGVSQVSNKLNSGKLVVSVADALTSVDKVTHYLDGETLNIVIHPLGSQNILAEKITISKAESVFDLAVFINTDTSQFFNSLTPSEQEAFASVPRIFVGNQANNLGQEVQVSTGENSSLSETMVWILEKLELPLNSDAASNLFQGMATATDFRPPKATPSTFEAAAICLGKNPVLPKIQKESFNKIPTTTPQIGLSKYSATGVEPNKNFPAGQSTRTEEQSEIVNQPQNDFSELDNSKVQSDWYLPKIFKSSSKNSNKT